MIKGIIFDLDGTLADTLPDLGNAMNRMLAQFGFPQRNREEHQNAICYGAKEFVRRSLPENKRDENTVSCCLAAYRTYYAAAYTEKTCPYAGVKDMLKALVNNGVLVAVYSNKPMAQTKQVVRHYFGDVPFVAVVGHVDGAPVKPDPTAALAIADIMGLSLDEIGFVGDSDVDMQTARNAGMLPIGALWGYRDKETLLRGGAKMLIEHPRQLLSLWRIQSV